MLHSIIELIKHYFFYFINYFCISRDSIASNESEILQDKTEKCLQVCDRFLSSPTQRCAYYYYVRYTVGGM